ncbi:MAG TPA: tRNA (N6-isopentenyl adenosine(37)-C2)-methylthiotransferase MiaB [Candidatus Fimimonas merdipullorum]|uniref:tRNA-2-methylthio-N(6)-dimethylallyladenosine synthase n=1 Tax=Candidatus Fimimonas merdipullorum TaxID=2840822 RepID=A0A9D1SP54_9BACT|nr:tRNA (N6-isopentenyl adenosine(37)-C2)-methylthiotransferase MiaB [Candidatus Fimimonas merdipullorum]
MNIHDSEKIAGILRDMGYDECNSPEEADVVVFNTCCIRETAEKKIYGHIGQMKKLKCKKPNLIVAVCGCMSQQEGASEHIRQSYPFVDVVLGTGNLNMLRQGIENAGRQRLFNTDFCCVREEDFPQYRTSYPNAWVNINYGCNNFCTYCIVPYVRGRERSRRPEDILAEVKGLLSDGYKEITLLGQNVNSYGKDIEGASFASLMREIGKLPGKFRLRFMTSHPKDLTQDIIDAVAEHKNICNNVHLPVQSGSSRILKAMNRRYDRESYLALVERIKECIPDVGITTDIMVGFPGETEEDFCDTLDLVRKAQFSSAFCFVYSPRKGTPASLMPQIDDAVKKDRITRLLACQNEVTKRISKTMVGKRYEVLVEGNNFRYKDTMCGRTESGRLVNFKCDSSLVGKFVTVKIERASSATLWGVVTEEE